MFDAHAVGRTITFEIHHFLSFIYRISKFVKEIIHENSLFTSLCFIQISTRLTSR